MACHLRSAGGKLQDQFDSTMILKVKMYSVNVLYT